MTLPQNLIKNDETIKLNLVLNQNTVSDEFNLLEKLNLVDK